jgi:four helix bundle protein
LNDAEAEAAETQTWLHFAVAASYVDADSMRQIFIDYDRIIGSIVNVIRNPELWLLQ